MLRICLCVRAATTTRTVYLCIILLDKISISITTKGVCVYRDVTSFCLLVRLMLRRPYYCVSKHQHISTSVSTSAHQFNQTIKRPNGPILLRSQKVKANIIYRKNTTRRFQTNGNIKVCADFVFFQKFEMPSSSVGERDISVCSF